MFNKYNTLKIILKISIFFSVMRFLMLLVLRSSFLYDFLHYHFSNDLIWIFLTLIFPLLTAVLIGYKLKSKFLTDLGKFFLPLLIILSVVGYGFNKNYWGYFVKRPSVFSELKKATEILSITDATKGFDNEDFQISKDTIHFNNSDHFSFLYYKNFERPFMQFGVLGQRGNLRSYKNIAQNSALKIPKSELNKIEKLILNSNFLEKPEIGYEEYGNELNIQIIEFTTSDKDSYVISNNLKDRSKPLFEYDNKYFMVTINSGQLSNDHYPIYEFLIENDEIKKKQKFFYDVAGIEGLEYSTFAPIAEIIILILSLILFALYKLIKKILKKKV